MSEKEINGVADRLAQRAVGERSQSASAPAASAGGPDPELVERPRQRRFSAEYKLRIAREADACDRPGEVGALLRREGLYSSLLTEWRRARDAGALEALERRAAGPGPARARPRSPNCAARPSGPRPSWSRRAR